MGTDVKERRREAGWRELVNADNLSQQYAFNRVVSSTN